MHSDRLRATFILGFCSLFAKELYHINPGWLRVIISGLAAGAIVFSLLAYFPSRLELEPKLAYFWHEWTALEEGPMLEALGGHYLASAEENTPAIRRKQIRLRVAFVLFSLSLGLLAVVAGLR